MSNSVAESRSAARLHGNTYYRAQDSCKHNHPPVRYTATGQCVECVRQAKQRYHQRKHGGTVAVTVRVHREDFTTAQVA